MEKNDCLKSYMFLTFNFVILIFRETRNELHSYSDQLQVFFITAFIAVAHEQDPSKCWLVIFGSILRLDDPGPDEKKYMKDH